MDSVPSVPLCYCMYGDDISTTLQEKEGKKPQELLFYLRFHGAPCVFVREDHVESAHFVCTNYFKGAFLHFYGGQFSYQYYTGFENRQ